MRWIEYSVVATKKACRYAEFDLTPLKSISYQSGKSTHGDHQFRDSGASHRF